MQVQQLSLFEPDVPAFPPPLLLLACSATKLDHAAPAIELYRGVMYETFKVHRCPATPLRVIILSGVPLIPAQFTGVATSSIHADFRATNT
ncbi:hypothetical protein [Cupriavidus sp. WS]|uniref:hypothetical protein n=1 Tax=Cupriavidus sp. WS TaxID=1312922 RepID=UPI00036B8CFE|nr:hypothetical protein [Cupriavidus sp. WS]